MNNEIICTIGQSKSEAWQSERTLRIAASSCKAFSGKLRTKLLHSFSEAVNEKLWFPEDYKSEAMKPGLKEEP